MGKQHLPWHYDHHMGRDQNANWCVTHPLFDNVMGTRKIYTYDENGRVIAEERPNGFVAGFLGRSSKAAASASASSPRVASTSPTRRSGLGRAAVRRRRLTSCRVM